MMSKYHTVSIRKKNFKDLQEIQKAIPINVSLNQTIEWLIKIGQKQINISKRPSFHTGMSAWKFRKCKKMGIRRYER